MAAKAPRASKSRTTANKSPACPIVGIGGSAGGFEAAMELLRHLPPRTGMAFVIVQHLDPHHATGFLNLLGKVTAMPVGARSQDDDAKTEHGLCAAAEQNVSSPRMAR